MAFVFRIDGVPHYATYFLNVDTTSMRYETVSVILGSGTEYFAGEVGASDLTLTNGDDQRPIIITGSMTGGVTNLNAELRAVEFQFHLALQPV